MLELSKRGRQLVQLCLHHTIMPLHHAPLPTFQLHLPPDCFVQVAALSLELSNMKRLEVQLNAELALVQQQLADSQQELASAR